MAASMPTTPMARVSWRTCARTRHIGIRPPVRLRCLARAGRVGRKPRIATRPRPRAEALRADFGAKLTVYDWVHAPNMLEGAATVINTTSLGMSGKHDFRVPLDALEPSALVTDLVYNPLKTQFLLEAESKGCTIVDGLGMLLHQAAPGFERWFGHRPEVDEATRNTVLTA